MRLLFLTPQSPYPPHQGTTLRNWGLIRGLAERHRITLLTFADDAGLPDALARVCERVVVVPSPRRSGARRLAQLASPLPDLAWRLHSPEFSHALSRLIEDSRFDVIHVEGLELGRACLHLAHRTDRPLVLYDAHNAEGLIQSRAFATDLRRPSRWPHALYSLLQLPRLRRFESRVLRGADRVTCVSAEDARALNALRPDLQPTVVPNGLHLHDYAARDWRRPEGLPAQSLVFTGKMDYRPNVDAAEWFAAEILPRVQAGCPEAHFVVVGQSPAERVRALARRPGVTVTGAVADVRPYLAHAAAFVAPLRMGGGTRLKLLQAMALRAPIVSTRIGAEGFEVEAGRELSLADSPADFAAAVRRVLSDASLRRTLAERGEAFVRANYDWSAILPRLEALYKRAG